MTEVLQLRQQLRRERLLVSSERREIEKITGDITQLADKTLQASWRVRQKYRSVDLLCSSQLTTSQCASCFQKADDASFAIAGDNGSGGDRSSTYNGSGSMSPSGNRSSHPVAMLDKQSQLLSLLRAQPEILARLLIFANSSKLDTKAIAEVILSGVFGNFLVPEDEYAVLYMLERALSMQLRACDDPPQILRGVSSAFTVTFNMFIEGYYGAHVYLSEVLSETVKNIAMDDEQYFEFESTKLAARFSENKRAQLFTPNMSPKSERVHKFISKAADKAARYCSMILQTLITKLGAIPMSLRWLLAAVFRDVKEKSSDQDAKLVVADLFLGQFICPAIVNPEVFIFHAAPPISSRARYNLTQIARVIQSTGCSSITGSVPAALKVVHDKLDMTSSLDYLDQLCTGVPATDRPPASAHESFIHRNSIFITEAQISCLLEALRKAELPLCLDNVAPQVLTLTNEMYEASTQQEPEKIEEKEKRSSLQRPRSDAKTPKRGSARPLSGPEPKGSASPLKPSPRPSPAVSMLAVFEEQSDAACNVLVIPVRDGNSSPVQLKSVNQVVHVVGNVESPGSGPDTGSARRSSGYGGYEEYEVMAPNMAPQVGTTLRRLSSSSESSVTVPQDVHRRSTVYPLGRPLSPVTSSPSTSSIPPTPIEKNNLDDAEYDEVYTPQQNTDDDFEQPEYSVLVRGPAPVRTKPLPIRQLSNSRLRSLSTSLPDVTEIQDISKYSESYTGMSPSPTTWDRPPAPLPILQKQGAISERPRRPLFTRTDSAPSMTSEEREVRQSPSPQHETPPSQISLCTTMSSPVLGTVTSLDSITSGSRSPSAGSGTGIRKISSAISLRVKRRSQQKDREVLPTVRDGAPSRSLTKCQSDISVVSGDSVSPVLSRTSIDISTPDRAVITTTLQDKKVHTGSPESSGTRSAVTTPNEKSASAKVPFWRNKRLSIYVSKRKESSTGEITPNATPVKMSSQLAISGTVSPEVAQPDQSILDDIARKYERLAQEQKDRKEAESRSESMSSEVSLTTDKQKETSRSSTSDGAEDLVYFQLKRHLESLLAEPPIADLCYTLPAKEELAELCLPEGCGNSVTLEALLEHELSNARYWGNSERLYEAAEAQSMLAELSAEDVDNLIQDMVKDLQERSAYFSYLLQVKHGLNSTMAYLEMIAKHIGRTNSSVHSIFTSACARIFLEKHSEFVDSFVEKFSALEMSDEKGVAVEEFLSELCTQLDEDAVWNGMSDAEWKAGQMTIERNCFSRIFRSAFWPNGEPDKLRDRIIHQHIESLSKSITVHHASLQIASKYCSQAPWPLAVEILDRLVLYKAPVDKLNVISECAQCIMSHLSRASRTAAICKNRHKAVDEAQIEFSVPGADDMFPVLVFVIIKANPPALLSTVAYVENFYRTRMQGESSYWWAQFISAVEYVKTIEI